MDENFIQEIEKARIFAKDIKIESYLRKTFNKNMTNGIIKHIAERHLRKTSYKDKQGDTYISREAMDVVMLEYRYDKKLYSGYKNDFFYNISNIKG